MSETETDKQTEDWAVEGGTNATGLELQWCQFWPHVAL